MKRKKWLSKLLAGSLCLALCAPLTAYADGQKVVTLGADLTQDQKIAVLKYFGIYGQNIETLTITNQDEREHLGSYVPLEQIGTRTFSCALVCPTSSGGIHVKTANLSWVTSNMIATTLSTSGVVNCDVLAASPFEVSGTGALTGIIMAYESATGMELNPTRKELATQELITTGQIANQIGQTQATNIVNEIKIQVIEGAVVEPEEVEEIVDEVVDENPEVNLSDEDRALLTGLMTQIAEQGYDYDEMKDTLQRVEENLNGLMENQTENVNSDEVVSIEETEPETLSSDSILMNTDDGALGDTVNIDATNDEAVPAETQPAGEAAADNGGFEISSSDTYSETESQDDFWNTDGGEGIPDNSNTDAEIVIPEAGDDFWSGDSTDGDTTIPEDDYDFWSGDSTDDGTTIPEGGDDFWSGDSTDDGSIVPENTDDFWGADGTDDGSDVPQDDGYAEGTEEPVETAVLELTECHKTPDSSDGTVAYAGDSQIKLVYGNGNLVPASGTLILTDAWGSQCASIDLTNKEQVRVSPISENDRTSYGWGEGTELIVNLGFCLQPDQSYNVAVEGVLVQTTDSSILEGVPAAAISADWTINTDTYGAGVSMNKVNDIYAGASLSGNVMMDETMASALISSYDAEKLSFDTTEFNPESTGFTMNCLQSGTASFTLDYFDAEGNYITSSTTEVFIP